LNDGRLLPTIEDARQQTDLTTSQRSFEIVGLLQLLNHSPFVGHITLLNDPRGVETLVVTVKGSFSLEGRALVIADVQQPLVMSDTYWGSPGQSSLHLPGEVHLAKPATDIVVAGEAGIDRSVTTLEVVVSVADRLMSILVLGDREWQGGPVGGRMTSPRPFERMPLIFERAFGGSHWTGSEGGPSGAPDHEPRNPAGRGFVARRKAAPARLSLPNLEDPRDRFAQPGDRPTPISPGAVAPHWLPRRAYAGTYDARWQASRAPFLPDDFDTRYLQVAHPRLIQASHLTGGERVELVHIAPWPRLSFALPICQLQISAMVSGRRHALPPRMETVLLSPADRRCELLWRATFPVDKRPLEVEHVEIYLQRVEAGTIARGCV